MGLENHSLPPRRLALSHAHTRQAALYINVGDTQGLLSVWIFDLVFSASLFPLYALRSKAHMACQPASRMKTPTSRRLRGVNY